VNSLKEIEASRKAYEEIMALSHEELQQRVREVNPVIMLMWLESIKELNTDDEGWED
tara:strand:+ start:7901 stop:8071 length:171 start_codon:yes stop_codon:yes gene_type:complete